MLSISEEDLEVLKGLCGHFKICCKCKDKNKLCFLKRGAYKTALKVYKKRNNSNKEVL